MIDRPNAFWANKTMFSSDSYVGSTSASTYNGYSNPLHATYQGPTDSSIPCIMDSTPCTQPYREGCAGNDLAATGIDATNASVILNIGHWVTYTAPVHAHIPGTNNFTYMAVDGWQVTKFVGAHSGCATNHPLLLSTHVSVAAAYTSRCRCVYWADTT